MSSITVCAAGVVASLLAVFLKKHNAEYSLIVSLCAVSVIVIYLIGTVIDIVSEIKSIYSFTNLDTHYLELILKCVGICFITEFTADCCKDAGQVSLSNIVLYGGRLSIALVALPLFKELLELIIQISGG